MKKIFLALAAVAMVLASCGKEEFSDNSNSVSENIKLNVTVAEFGYDEAATKAMIKEDWADGDQISIWLDGNATTNPNYVIKHNSTESKWLQDNTATTEAATPKASGYVKALYNGQVCVASKDSYNYSNNTLSFNIENWKFLTEIQVVVTGISSNASDYTLACDKFTPLSGYEVGNDTITAITGTKGDAVAGFASTANPDCATFVFATGDYTIGDAIDSYTFTLIKTSSIKTKVSYSVSKALQSSTKMKGLKLAYSGFSHDYVDLGLSVKWATCNVGAISSEEVGNGFAWGETEPKASYSWSNYKWCNGSYNTQTKYCHQSSYGTVDNITVLEAADDAATVNWGSVWRMPTIEECNELMSDSNCSWTWYAAGNTEFGGVAGYKVTSKKTGYTDKFIFLPTTNSDNTYGYYWSSSLDNDYAYDARSMDFHYGRKYWNRGYRSDGRVFRAVLKEN